MRQFGIRLEQRELIGVLNTIPLNSLRFVIEETIGSKCSDKVHQEIVDRPVSGVKIVIEGSGTWVWVPVPQR